MYNLMTFTVQAKVSAAAFSHAVQHPHLVPALWVQGREGGDR